MSAWCPRVVFTMLQLLCCILSVVSVTHAEEQLRVGMLLPLTGNFAAIGADTKKGVELALKEHPATSLQLVFADTQAEGLRAVTEFKRLTTAENVEVVYAFRGPVGMALNPISKSMKIPLLGGVGNKNFAEENQFAFQVWPRSDFEGKFLADEIRASGHQRLAQITVEDDWTDAVSSSLAYHAVRNRLENVFTETVQASESDFRTLLVRMSKSNPDVVFLNLSISQIGVAIRQVRELGITVPIYSNFWAAKPEVLAAAGDTAIRGVRYAEMRTELPTMPEGTSGATLSAYVATQMLIAAHQTKKPIYEGLAGIEEITTAAGVFSVQHRCVIFPMVLRTIE